MSNSIANRYQNDPVRLTRYQELQSNLLRAYSSAHRGKQASATFASSCVFQLAYQLETYEHQFQTRFESFSYSQFSSFYQQALLGKASSPFRLRSMLELLSDYLDYLVATNVISPAQSGSHPYWQLVNSQTLEQLISPASQQEESLMYQALDVYSRQMLFSQQEFESMLEAIFPFVGRDCIQRAVYVLAWCGADPKTIPLIKKADVDTNRMIIHATAQNQLPQDLIIPTSYCRIELKRAMNADGFELARVGHNGRAEAHTIPFYGRDEYIVRGKKGPRSNSGSEPDPVVTGQNIVNRVTRIYTKRQADLPPDSPFKNKNVTLQSCNLSGQFVRIKKEEIPLDKLRQFYGSTFVYSYRKWLSYWQLAQKK